MGINRAVTSHGQTLYNKLNLFHLIAFGLNYMIPFAPAIIFGAVAKASGTTVALPYLLAMIIMSFTAFSYIYMVKRNPVAGSLYSYVESILGKRVGFLAGWILFLDYILIPTVVAISATIYLQHYLPNIPYAVILCTYVLSTGLFNLLGIRIVANIGLIILLLMEVLLVVCLYTLGNHIVSQGKSLFSIQPFAFTSISSLCVATTLCVLSYLGYDAISTLAEEAKNPVKDIPKAIIISLLVSGTMMFILGYLAVLATPDISQNFNNNDWVDSALFYITNDVGGPLFTVIFTSGLILCLMVFNIVATAAGARLLFGMGRDRALPRYIFGSINTRFKTPHYNILIIVIIELVLGLSISLSYIVNLVNFGAILGFTILNLSVFYKIYKYNKNNRSLKNIVMLLPLIGAVSMITMITLMEAYTIIVGVVWTIMGIAIMLSNKYLRQHKCNMNSNTTLKNITINNYNDREQVIKLKNHWDYDNWNVSDTLINMILKVNPQAMIILEKDHGVVGSILAYNYTSKFSYFGLYYIAPEHRGNNYGAYLTGAAMIHWQKRNLACDAVYSQVIKYQRLGFDPIYENKRFVFTPQADTTQSATNIITTKSIDTDRIAEYDLKHFYCKRINEIEFIINDTECKSFAYIDKESETITGFINISPSKEAYRIGPLYADDSSIAIELIKKATEHYTGHLINIDIPMINIHKNNIINYFLMTETTMKFIRMHKGTLEVNNINSVYGHLSIELG